MLDGLSGLPIVVIGFLASLLAGLATGLGAVLIFLRRRWSRTAQVLMLAAAAGVMLGATMFSLVHPALEIVVGRTGSPVQAALVASGGLMLGAAAVWFVHARVPHKHFVRGSDGQHPTFHLGRHWLFILAIALHNFPEGMSVGVAYGAGFQSGLAVTLGIGLHNVLEGLAVAAALVGDGFTRGRAFGIALLTGLFEPLGGLFGAVAVGVSEQLLPWALAFAGGAMLYVVSGEVIPETHREGRERRATFGLVLGFSVMMWLDVVFEEPAEHTPPPATQNDSAAAERSGDATCPRAPTSV